MRRNALVLLGLVLCCGAMSARAQISDGALQSAIAGELGAPPPTGSLTSTPSPMVGCPPPAQPCLEPTRRPAALLQRR